MTPRTATAAALARIMAGETISAVARDTGLDRSNLHRNLRTAGKRAPRMGQRGRPKGVRNKPKDSRPTSG